MNFSRTEKILLVVLSATLILIAAGVITLLVLPGGLLASPPQMTPEEAIAKWRQPIGYSGILSMICDGSLEVANDAETATWGLSQVSISIMVYPFLSAIEQTIPDWQAAPDQVAIKESIRGNVTSLRAIVENMTDQQPADFAQALSGQCDIIKKTNDNIVSLAKEDGATDQAIRAVLEEDEN